MNVFACASYECAPEGRHVGRTSGLSASNFHVVLPSSSESLHQRSPTSSRPLMFFTCVEKRRAMCQYEEDHTGDARITITASSTAARPVSSTRLLCARGHFLPAILTVQKSTASNSTTTTKFVTNAESPVFTSSPVPVVERHAHTYTFTQLDRQTDTQACTYAQG